MSLCIQSNCGKIQTRIAPNTELRPTSYATSEETIKKLCIVFPSFGLLEQILTENCCSFTIVEFEKSLQQNGIQQIPKHHTILHQMDKLKEQLKFSKLQ